MSLNQSVNAFNHALLSAITKAAGQQNVFYSSYSIMSAFSMVLVGARGNTEANLLAGLKLTGLNRQQIADAFEKSISALTASSAEHELKTANKIMVQTDFKPLEEYLAVLVKNFKATIESRDLSSPETITALNQWVGKETNGMIKELLTGPVSADTKLILANAIYFKGKWQKQFEPRHTKPRPFRAINGTSNDVPTMNIKMEIDVHRAAKYFVFELPYKGTTSMVIVLPVDMDGLDKVLEEEKDTDFVAKLDEAYKEEVELYLPKFKFELKTDLMSVLPALGITDIFDPTKSDLTGVAAKGGLYVGDAIHKAVVEVDEEGTRAAAATAMQMRLMSLPLPPLRLHVDHPFLFYIVDSETKMILFTGRVNKL